MGQKAFTLIEVLISISIVAVLASFTLPFFGFEHVFGNNNYKAQIIENIELARLKSLAGENNKKHGVYFDVNNNNFVLFQGDTYLLRDSDYDREFVLPGNLSLSTTLNDNEIVFNKYDGQADFFGLVNLEDRNNGTNYQILIDQFAFVSEN